MSNSLRGKKISESFPRLVQVINGVFYDGTGQPLLTLNGATAGIGPQGIQGLRGPIGFDGSRGFQGYQGVDGAFAGRGFQGFQGPSPVYETVLTFQGVWDASTNTPTLSGATGASGDTYIVGATGVQNLGGGTVSYSVNDLIIYSQSQWVRAGSASFGAQGAQGAPGLDGNEGAQGPQGVEGFQGTQGVPGEYAAIGLQGFQGFEGFQGAQGVEGFQGAQGPEPVFPTVLDLKGIWNAETNVPPINNAALPGYLTGSTGDTWLVGVTGTQDLGSGPIFFGVNDLVVYVNSVWVNTGNSTVGIQGAQGPQGIQGSEGPQGFQGFQGFDGVQGFQGWQGDFGPTGNQGPQGPQGVQGSQGLRGFQGIQGVQGDQGPQGIQGSQGPQGVQGPQGTQGSQGSEGPQGFQGFQGPQGYQGATGPQPIFPSVLTFKGVWNADTNNPTLVNGTGSTGDTYIVGVTGSKDLGAGATVTYNVNDLVVYSEAQWKKAGSATTGVQGSQGWQGVQGIQGVQGAQGWQGPQGVQGIQGSQGAQGWQGPQGIQGVQGAQGSQGLQGDTGSSGDIGFQGVQGFGFQGNQGWQGIPGPTGQSLSGVFVSAPITGAGSTSTNPVTLIYSTDFDLTTVGTPGFQEGIGLNLDATTIVTPSIVSYSQIFKSDGFTPFGATTISGSTVGPVSSSNNPTVPNGCRVIYGGTATIPTAGAGQGTPTAVSGAFIFSPSPPSSFPAVGVTNPSTQLTTTTTFSVNISKPKSGLIVSAGQVVRASGSDTSTASATVTFSNVFYYGFLQVGPISTPISQATVDLIGATSVAGDPLTQGIQNMTGLTYRFGTKAQSFAVTNGNYGPGYRVVFAYPASLGNVSTLTVTGSTINQIGAFTRASVDVPIVTISGTTVAYRLYVSNADNAWNTTITTT